MKRLLSLLAIVGMTLSSVGCCYHSGGFNTANGTAYGGHWQPGCFGPLDPFGLWCGGNSGYGGAYGGGNGYGGNGYGGNCCQPNFGNGYGGPMVMPQTFASPNGYSNGMPSGQMVPDGSLKPTPAPGADGTTPPSAPKKNMTLIVPQPVTLDGTIQGANNAQMIQAF